jgi:hypothetical protein
LKFFQTKAPTNTRQQTDAATATTARLFEAGLDGLDGRLG